MKSKERQKKGMPAIVTTRNILIAAAAVFAAFSLFITIQVASKKMMFQPPVLVQAKPVVTFVSGNAFFRKRPSSVWELAIVGRELEKSFEVKTEKESQLDIRFHAGTAVTVTENSIMKIDELSVSRLFINLERGSFFGKFQKLFNDHELQIQTPSTIAAVRGTDLGFEVFEDGVRSNTSPTNATNGAPAQADISFATTVYALSGITEVHNPRFQEQKILLSYQNKITVSEDNAPENTGKMTDEEILRMRAKMNAIHFNEVLFISDKITFRKGSAEIQDASFPELDKIVTIIKAKGARIRIEGHTDTQGDAVFNQTLSVKRAEAIKLYLIEKGIKKEKLETVGYGTSMPISDNRTEKGRALNRRVEFIVIK